MTRVRLIAAGEGAECDAAYALEDAGELQVRPHAIEPVGPLTLVLEQQDRPIERRHERGAEQPCQHRQVAAEQRPLRRAAHVGRRSGKRRCRACRLQELEEPRMRRGREAGQLREHRPVEADAAVGLEP